MPYTEIAGMGFWFMSTSSGIVPGMLFINTEPGSADEGYLWQSVAGDWVDPTGVTDYTDSGLMKTMTQYHATLFQGRRYFADVATLGGSPGQVEVVVVNSATGVYLGVMGPFTVRSDTLFREAGFDPRVDTFFGAHTWNEAIAAVVGTIGGVCTPELNTPSSGLTRHQFKIDSTVVNTVTTEDATKGKRTANTLPSF